MPHKGAVAIRSKTAERSCRETTVGGNPNYGCPLSPRPMGPHRDAISNMVVFHALRWTHREPGLIRAANPYGARSLYGKDSNAAGSMHGTCKRVTHSANGVQMKLLRFLFTHAACCCESFFTRHCHSGNAVSMKEICYGFSSRKLVVHWCRSRS